MLNIYLWTQKCTNSYEVSFNQCLLVPFIGLMYDFEGSDVQNWTLLKAAQNIHHPVL